MNLLIKSREHHSIVVLKALFTILYDELGIYIVWKAKNVT